MGSCCTPVLHGWFVRESLFKIGLRHTGVFCAGRIEAIAGGDWFVDGRQVKTGEVYE